MKKLSNFHFTLADAENKDHRSSGGKEHTKQGMNTPFSKNGRITMIKWLRFL